MYEKNGEIHFQNLQSSLNGSKIDQISCFLDQRFLCIGLLTMGTELGSGVVPATG